MFTRVTHHTLLHYYPIRQRKLISHSGTDQITIRQTTLETIIETIVHLIIVTSFLILKRHLITPHRVLHLSQIQINFDTIKRIFNLTKISSLLILRTIIRRNNHSIRIIPLGITTRLRLQRILLIPPINYHRQISRKRPFLLSSVPDVISLDTRPRPVQVSRTGVIERWCCLRS